ncbi:hypothetical protein [Burkholderia sp. IT-111MI5]|uniref:hypothetical protein n=1 Tax=Burkholderia sp. IT-111MI5 TaxID=3026439 RepID=UPI0039DF8E16
MTSNLLTGGAGALVGGGTGALTSASVDRFNRQLHPNEKKLAEQLAAKAKSQGVKNADGSPVTSTDIANQLAQMGYAANGVFESGAAATVEGTKPDDGSKWVNAGVNQNTGKTVWAQIPGSANPEVQTFILKNTNGADVPLVQQYSASATGASNAKSSGTVTGPFTRLPNQADLGYIKSTTTDLASATSTTAGWIGATTGALASAPTPLAPAFAGISYATTVVGVGADAVGQVLNPNVGQYWVGGGVNVLSNYVSGKYPVIGPIVNAIGNTFNNDDYVGKLQNSITSYWQSVVKSVPAGGGGKGAKN